MSTLTQAVSADFRCISLHDLFKDGETAVYRLDRDLRLLATTWINYPDDHTLPFVSVYQGNGVWHDQFAPIEDEL